jgi:hypothetical protein
LARDVFRKDNGYRPDNKVIIQPDDKINVTMQLDDDKTN